jgi:hypothetical protein
MVPTGVAFRTACGADLAVEVVDVREGSSSVR